MEGLASIVLAVAQLEQQHEGKSLTGQLGSTDAFLKHFSHPSTTPSHQESRHDPTTLSISMAMPSRHPFTQSKARVVSEDPSCGDGDANLNDQRSQRSSSESSVEDSSAGRSAGNSLTLPAWASPRQENSPSSEEYSPRSVHAAVVSNPSTPSSSPSVSLSSSSSLSSTTDSSNVDAVAAAMEEPHIPASAADLTIQQHVPPPPPPTEVITDVLVDDVLCGRGGETNHHPGNIRYRTLVKCYQPLYIVSKRRDKPRIAQKIVLTIRERGGRFLKKDARSNTWRDVGNVKAREKTSQALREGAPELRNVNGKDQQDIQDSGQVLKSAPANTNLVPQQESPAIYPQATEIPSVVASSARIVEDKYDTSKKRKRSSMSNLTPAGFDVGIPHSSTSKLALGNFVTAVSVEDEEDKMNSGCTTGQEPSKAIIRGPRLKRLKKRLESSSIEVSCMVGQGR